jgi:hypothetical protein
VVEYAVIQALEVGLGVLIGAFVMGLFSDRFVPSLLIRIWGIRQRSAILEQVST